MAQNSQSFLMWAFFSFASLFWCTASAAMTPSDLRNTCHSLARMAFDLKDLAVTVQTSRQPGLMPDIMAEFDDLFDSGLSSISLLAGSASITNQPQQQYVYEAFSYTVQGLFELMDAMASGAGTFVNLDKQAEFRIPSVIRQVGGVIDAFLFLVIAQFPPDSSYATQSLNQKAQVDTHLRQVIHAFHLATAKSGSPYQVEETVLGLPDQLDNSTDDGSA